MSTRLAAVLLPLALLLPTACGGTTASASDNINWSTRMDDGQGSATFNGLTFTVADAGSHVAGALGPASSIAHTKIDHDTAKILLGFVEIEIERATNTLRLGGKSYGTLAAGDTIAIGAEIDGTRKVSVNGEERTGQ